MADPRRRTGRIRPRRSGRILSAAGHRRSDSNPEERMGHKIMSFTRTKVGTSIAALVLAGGLVIAPYAGAATTSGTTTVSCDGSTVKNLAQGPAAG